MAATSSKRLRHAHGCVTCRGRYDDTCASPQDNGTCVQCRGQRGWDVLIAGRLPRDCCRAHSRLASKDERALYQLSAACTWWLCSVCARTFPFDSPTPDPNGAA